jgi:tetratricopeptide (TPR) repeat protein
VKEYLAYRAQQGKRSSIDDVIDTLIERVGARQFEVMPTRVLEQSNSPAVRYVLGKKYFRENNFSAVLKNVTSVPSGHPVKPYALLLEGGALSIMGRQDEAIDAYKECIRVSDRAMGNARNVLRKKQLEINRDYCQIGIGRAQFAAGRYTLAEAAYSGLPKQSYVWPEILFEEAWNAFYIGEYNRTLGKLVTYKAPPLSHYFNPETEVLTAMTYLHMCLYDDARKTIDTFYGNYESDARGVRNFLDSHSGDYRLFFDMARGRESGTVRGNALMNVFMNDIVNEPTYKELRDVLVEAAKELPKTSRTGAGRFGKILERSLRETIGVQRNLIGAWVKSSLSNRYIQMYKSFSGMSYIKLEVLARAKDVLYQRESGYRVRGDIKNLERKENQYFWSFNGEFWADEIGDYVFDLKSECKK